jgi:alpha-mannosidase
MTRKAHYVLSTHWDREWYQPFQDYRYRLVHLLDRVLEGWQQEDLAGPFQTDGQAIMLEDYLEVRPERTDEIRQLVKEGRFIVGPWYVLPDEFLVSGEAIIRNLRLGRQVARELGGQPSSAGFMCDMFGHNSQMPQILTGFGIRGGFLWRGANQVDQHLMRWRGADGTELPCYRFGKIGYCSYAVQVRGANPTDLRPTPELVEERLQAFLLEEDAKTSIGPLLLFDGGDHMEWDSKAYEVLASHLGKNNGQFEIEHSSLEAYLDGLVSAAGEIECVAEGELREPGLYPSSDDAQWLIPGVTSSRVRIKQANATCQSLLTQWAEPVSAFADQALGFGYPRGFMDVAWRWLLQNHPHDSICGCSIDIVHEDMFYRFHQTEQIAQRLTQEAGLRLAASVEGPSDANTVRVAVFNPLPRPFDGTADLALELPVGWPNFYEMMGTFEALPAFRVFDAAGEEIGYQRTGQSMGRARLRTMDVVFPQGYQVNVVRVSLPLQIPALGYTTLYLRAEESGTPVRYKTGLGMAVSSSAMENEYLSITFEIDGTLTVTDKRTGQTYRSLMTYEDHADIGDGWNFGPAVNDQVFFSSGTRTGLAMVENGPYKTTFRVRTVLEIPADFDFTDMVRAEKTQSMTIDSLVTLRAGADWVEVETTVHNTVLDHRLRVIFPSGTQASSCLMDTPFDMVERPIALRADNDVIRELEVEHRPQQSLTAVFDQADGAEGRGLAVVSTGLLECAVQDLPERPIALTLLRATRRTVMTNGEPGGQEQGDLKFRYWIVPIGGAPDRARLLELGQMLSGGLRSFSLSAVDVAQYKQPVEMPAGASFLRVDGPAVLTSLRQEGEGLEARLFNPNTSPVEVVLDLSGWPESMQLPVEAQMVDLESNPLGQPLQVEQGRVNVSFGPKQIRTIRF